MNNNPFKYGAIVSGLYFTDREKEIKELITDFINGQHIIISSPRRYGKSSLVLKAMENAKSKGALGIYVDLFRASSKKRFAEIFSTAIARGTQSKISQVGRTLKEIIPNIIPKVVLKGEGEMEFDIEFGNRETDIDSLLDNMFDAPQKIALRKKKRVIVIFDEFQEIANFNGQQLQKVLRAKIQHHQQVTYCFLGSKRQLISELFLKQKSPFYRFGKMIELNKIPRSEMVKFI
ncbi:MAG: AAA family ATPase, partial [Candidatus Omnitrophica bacterium]|nr:AAA family ATPase [Candidatus Omnitrophota bacterium]